MTLRNIAFSMNQQRREKEAIEALKTLERVEKIKQYTTVHEDKQGYRYIVYKDDLAWLIEQVEQTLNGKIKGL